jgi:DNA-binding MarR family transcriptional regulator
MLEYKKNGKTLLCILVVIFIITEIIDLSLDHFFGESFIHTVLQIILFIFLFMATYKFFMKYSNKRIKELIPEELMKILEIIKTEKSKGILINQRKMRELLNITKPTLKKRMNLLLELQYVDFEERGSSRYFILTEKGESLFD